MWSTRTRAREFEFEILRLVVVGDSSIALRIHSGKKATNKNKNSRRQQKNNKNNRVDCGNEQKVHKAIYDKCAAVHFQFSMVYELRGTLTHVHQCIVNADECGAARHDGQYTKQIAHFNSYTEWVRVQTRPNHSRSLLFSFNAKIYAPAEVGVHADCRLWAFIYLYANKSQLWKCAQFFFLRQLSLWLLLSAVRCVFFSVGKRLYCHNKDIDGFLIDQMTWGDGGRETKRSVYIVIDKTAPFSGRISSVHFSAGKIPISLFFSFLLQITSNLRSFPGHE